MSIAPGVHTQVNYLGDTFTFVLPTVNPAASGSTFFIGVGWFKAITVPPPTIADNHGNVYSQISTTGQYSTDPYYSAIYICENAIGGSTDVTLTFTDPVIGYATFVEIKGGLTSGILDQAPNSNFTTTSPYTSLTTSATAQANELLIGFTITATSSGTETLTWGNSFTQLEANGDSNGATGGVAYRVVAATGTYQTSFTAAGAGTTGGMVFIATFKELPVGGCAASVNAYSYVTP